MAFFDREGTSEESENYYGLNIEYCIIELKHIERQEDRFSSW